MPAQCSKTNQRHELLRTCSEQRTNGGDSRRRVRLSFGRWRKGKNSRLRSWVAPKGSMQVLAARPTLRSSRASPDGERPAEGRAARDDEGLRTLAREAGEPTAGGRTARHSEARVDSDEERRLARDATSSNATLQTG